MPWNGSGAFSRDNGANTGATVWQDDRDAGTLIRADNHDVHDQDLSDGIQACVAKNGENAFTGNANLGGNKATNAAAGSAASDLPTMSQAQAGTLQYAADTGAANAYAVALSPAATAYTAGMKVCFKAANSNTGSSTINVNAIGAKNIFSGGAALGGGEILANDMVELRYDGTQFQIVSSGNAKSIYGPASSVAGPHTVRKFTGDDHPAFQTLAWAHDNITLGFDAYWDGTNWISSDAGSNFFINKNNDQLKFYVDSGVAAGSSVSYTAVLTIDTNGNLSMPNDSNGTTTNLLKIGAGNDLRLFHDGNASFLQHSGPTDFYMQNTEADRYVYVSAKNTGGVQRTVAQFSATLGSTFYVDGTTTARFDSSGFDLVAGVALGPNGSVGAPTWSFSGDSDTGAYRSSTNNYAIAAGGSVAAVFSAFSTKISSGDLRVGSASQLNLDGSGTHPTITAANAGGDLYLKNATAGREVYITGADAGSVERNLFFGNPDDYSQMYHNGTWRVRADSTGGITNGSIEPITDNLHDVGAPTFRWDDVRATNGTIQTSDRNEKMDIATIGLGSEFIDALNPVVYRWRNGKSGRLHNGLIAQDVEAVLQKFGIPTSDFAGFIRDQLKERDGTPVTDENGVQVERLGLRIGEFIPIMMKNLQQSNEKIRQLEADNAALKARLAAIEAKLAGV